MTATEEREELKQVNVRLRPVTVDKLATLCHDIGVSQSAIVSAGLNVLWGMKHLESKAWEQMMLSLVKLDSDA